MREVIEHLILEENVRTFLFGSRSKFDELCHIVVTQLQEKYPNIVRVVYLCKHEAVCSVGEGLQTQQSLKQITGQEVYCGEYEERKNSEKINSAGRASYVERNQWIIDDSNFVIIHLDKTRKTQKVSGTALAHQYAEKKKRSIFYI